MSSEELIAIIKNLPLKEANKTDDAIKLLAEELKCIVVQLKEMTPLAKIHSKGNGDKLKKLQKTITTLKSQLNELDPHLKEYLWYEINNRFKISGFSEYPHSDEICNFLTPIEKCSESFAASTQTLPTKKELSLREEKKGNHFFTYMDLIDDSLGKLYVKATGNDIGMSKESGIKGPLFRFIRDTFEYADITRKASTATEGIVKRSKYP